MLVNGALLRCSSTRNTNEKAYLPCYTQMCMSSTTYVIMDDPKWCCKAHACGLLAPAAPLRRLLLTQTSSAHHAYFVAPLKSWVDVA
mmetsp:Transcript_30417/g.90162  ORF Transcript_30417/g.90162 Transcript_30417/m.90162 type:complete len:87 (+) Transcript_30417:364-624(+)|eukprot:364681-Chlamydomonas_euryale.AAC.14